MLMKKFSGNIGYDISIGILRLFVASFVAPKSLRGCDFFKK
jgi:hypothetical protein